MRTEPARHLHVVDAETGETLDGCPDCRKKDHIIEGLQSNVAGWASKYGKLAADKEQEALEHELYETGREWHDYWRQACNHPRCEYGPDEFWQILPFLKSKVLAGLVGRAIDGAAFDPNTVLRRNGHVERFDSWELIFRNRSKFYSFVNRAPRRTA